MDFHLRRRNLLERALRFEEKARDERNAQAQDLTRALAALYREMSEELEDGGVFERRFPPLYFADLAGDGRSTSAGPLTNTERLSYPLTTMATELRSRAV